MTKRGGGGGGRWSYRRMLREGGVSGTKGKKGWGV